MQISVLCDQCFSWYTSASLHSSLYSYIFVVCCAVAWCAICYCVSPL